MQPFSLTCPIASATSSSFNFRTRILAFTLCALMIHPGLAEPGAVLTTEVPIVGGEAPCARAITAGDATVASQTGAFQYRYPIEVPPGRLGVAPALALSYSSQASVYGGIAAGWSLELAFGPAGCNPSTRAGIG